MKNKNKISVLLGSIILFFLILITACAGKFSKSVLQDSEDTPEVPVESTVEILTKNGGHLSVNKKTGQIAFDRRGDDGYFDLWVMDSDSKNQKCLTSNHPNLPNKHIGQPAWHPDGEYIVIQVQKDGIPKKYDNTSVPGAGVLNDIWLISSDGKKVWEIYSVDDELSKNSKGVLHPHFSHDGNKILWSERIKDNGKAFGEWILKIGDFKFDETGIPHIQNIKEYNPGGKSSFFESHGFAPDDKYILFSGNQDGPLEIYEMELETNKIKRLTTNAADTWDEHAHYSSNGGKIIWMSSKNLIFRTFPFMLQTEFWIMNRDGTDKKQLTYFHDKKHPHYIDEDFAVAADFDWIKNDEGIIGLVITNHPDSEKRGSGYIVSIKFDE